MKKCVIRFEEDKPVEVLPVRSYMNSADLESLKATCKVNADALRRSRDAAKTAVLSTLGKLQAGVMKAASALAWLYCELLYDRGEFSERLSLDDAYKADELVPKPGQFTAVRDSVIEALELDAVEEKGEPLFWEKSNEVIGARPPEEPPAEEVQDE